MDDVLAIIIAPITASHTYTLAVAVIKDAGVTETEKTLQRRVLE